MAIFTPTGYRFKYNLTHPHKVIMHLLRDIHCAWQRATKGYCYRDIWNIDNWFFELFPVMLEDYKNVHCGHPCSLTSEEWNDIIQQMIDCFKNADEDTSDFINPYEEEYLNTLSINWESNTLDCSADEELKYNYYKYCNMKNAYLEENLDKGFSLLNKYIRCLWD